MLSINLVPEVKKEQAKIRKTNLLVVTVAIIVGGSLLAVVLLLISLIGYRAARISSTNKKITEVTEQLKPYKELEASVTTLETGIAEIKGILDGGRNWITFLEDIEKATPNDIQIVSLGVNSGKVTLSLKGRDVRSVDRFIRSFSSYKNSAGVNIYTNVSVNGYNYDGNVVTFQATFDEMETK